MTKTLHLSAPLGATELDQLFARQDIDALTLAAETASLPAHQLWQPHPQGALLHRSTFYQWREPWLAETLLPLAPQQLTQTGGIRHPLRPRDPTGVLYQRFIPSLERQLTLRLVDINEDGERFHRWQNDPRVAAFWEYPFGRDALDQYLAERLADPHCTPLIGCFDGVPFGYFECYWVREDRLGPYCDAGLFDQGFHCLVGELDFLGRDNTQAWLNGLSHFLFLREPRCQTLFGEPRADNTAMLKYLQWTSWQKRHEFDFPHKRAALLSCDRESFFLETRL
ncbi:GNAT family N-acetyltransferase [Gallaecimonas xiamenensis]|uniref:Acyltransferase MbtK/IucB-like conserved domain-containing protein n=1 Tax=Gallaecimonas xiamenensis 3-C-1 TaxID=745411 RepID=K2J6F5_9GAMM|nr:GNAT family N-acetyltransferase [Gallaecimonas xiamenensis]EKE70618.1 hypothetical protein B3C1_13808 [Gallaecimonas xiamenensis 3-C-1]